MKKYLWLCLVVMLMAALIVAPAMAEGVDAEPSAAGLDWATLLSSLLYGVLSVAVAVVSRYVIPWVKTVTNEKIIGIANQEIRDALSSALDAVLTAVTVTNQTYVDTLKDNNIFDAAAQQEAMRRSMVTAKALLTDAAREALIDLYGSVESWLTLKIEQTTKELKAGWGVAEIEEAEGIARGVPVSAVATDR